MPQPFVFKHTINVRPEDLDELNHVNNVVYISYLQEAAIAHWHAAVSKDIIDSIRWVVRKHEIEYFKPAYENDLLEVSTWISEFTQVSTLRAYEIKRGDELLVKATTLWIALDSKTLKPSRVPKHILESFFQSSML
jgi:acyl-CoA thioester hydrolase